MCFKGLRGKNSEKIAIIFKTEKKYWGQLGTPKPLSRYGLYACDTLTKVVINLLGKKPQPTKCAKSNISFALLCFLPLFLVLLLHCQERKTGCDIGCSHTSQDLHLLSVCLSIR